MTNKLQILRDELDADPLTRGYSGMTDQQVADSLNTADRTWARETITARQMIEAIDWGEFPARMAVPGNFEYLSLLISAGEIGVNATEVKAALIQSGGVFNNTNAPLTRANLIALATETISRAEELARTNAVSIGGAVLPGTVAQARAL